ncbi:MAG: thiol-disulfide oxidoreductase DCC family protein [Gemmatimonadales bacterium]
MLREGFVGVAARVPTRPTLIYNGQCGFCLKWVARVERWDRDREIRLLPLQDAEAELISGRSRDALHEAVHFVRPDGAVFAGARAARELFRYLRGGWPIFAALHVPGAMFLAARAYSWVARTWGPVR